MLSILINKIASMYGETSSLNNKKYTKLDRLRKTCDYSYLSKYGGKKYFTTYFILISRANGKLRSRLGVTVSKKVGNAVIRNRVKRVIREYFRCYVKDILKSEDVNVIARKGLGGFSSSEILQNLDKAFNDMFNRKNNLLN